MIIIIIFIIVAAAAVFVVVVAKQCKTPETWHNDKQTELVCLNCYFLGYLCITFRTYMNPIKFKKELIRVSEKSFIIIIYCCCYYFNIRTQFVPSLEKIPPPKKKTKKTTTKNPNNNSITSIGDTDTDK